MLEDGVWRTVKGRRIFIKTGQSLKDAIRESLEQSKSKGKSKAKVIGTLEDEIDFVKENEKELLDAINNADNNDEADKRLCEVLQEKQGFNEKPTVLSKEEFDKLKDDDYIKVYRGISDGVKSADEYIEQFKNGKNEYGSGLTAYGVGHYTTTSKDVAESYGTVMEIAIPKDAKIATFNATSVDKTDLYTKHVKRYEKYVNNGYWYYDKYGDNVTSILDEMERETNTTAILEGYDAIKVIEENKNQTTYIILNRGKVKVKE